MDQQRKEKLTVVFQVHNEEKHIGVAVKSAQLLSESVLVMDMESTDRTAIEAQEAGAKVIPIPKAPYVEPVRPLAFTKTQAEWILILDADERMTPELAKEIRSVLTQNEFTHFAIPRRNLFAGKKWLQHGGWWPDSQTRLIKREAFVSWPREIHSTAQVRGKRQQLRSAFLHLFHGDLEEMVKKTINFEDQEAELLFAAKRPVTTATFFRKFLGELYRRLIKKQGFLDGGYGLIESVYQAYSKTITYLLLYEKQHS